MQSPLVSILHRLAYSQISKGNIILWTIHYRKFWFSIEVYSDSDWPGCPSTRRSTTRTFFGDNCALDHRRSNLRYLGLALRPDAEYRAMTVATAELTWLTFLLKDFHVELPSTPVLYCDNVNAHLPIFQDLRDNSKSNFSCSDIWTNL